MVVNPFIWCQAGLPTLAGHYWILHFLSRLDSLAVVPVLGPKVVGRDWRVGDGEVSDPRLRRRRAPRRHSGDRPVSLRGLQHVSSPVPDGRQGDVRRFYGELLGLREVPVPRTLMESRLVWFSGGPGLELHFFPGVTDPTSERHFCLDVENLEETRRNLTEAGCEPYDDIAIPNRPRFFCRDPFGNLIEFTSIEGDYLAG
jgi:catechol 2,3-dioxygenase-like lactoylglutathione lyase family enzyme